MSLRRLFVLIAILTSAGQVVTHCQEMGSLEIAGRVKIAGKNEKLVRKRFYLFRGGLAENKALVDRIKAATFISRDCFYCQTKASAEYRAWLKAEDCESPYCREITAADRQKVPEFQSAYQAGLLKIKSKPDVVEDWLTVYMPSPLRDGFYRQRKSFVETLLAGTKPLQTSMTDSVSVKAIFIDILVKPAAGKQTETFLFSNLVPIEVGQKSYVWACEVDIGAAKLAKPQLQVPEPGKTIRRCEVIVRDLPSCAAGACTPST